jgi:hypothetical protein
MAEQLAFFPRVSRLQGRHAVRIALSVIASTLVAAAARGQVPIAHWSFDTPTLTTDGSGNITGVDDVAGAHDAVVSATGVGAAGPSAPFVGTDSVSGAFGQGLRFNGNNYMVFPNLTELMQSSGAPSYTVSLWIKWLNPAAPGGPNPFNTFSTWGNAGAGTANQDSRFSYAFGPNAASTIRGQTRHESASGNGTDIYARTTTVPTPVNNGNWHMLTWTFDTSNGMLDVYYDGTFVETFTSTAASFQLADNTSPFGSFGLKGDDANVANRFLPMDTQLDEVWVFNSVLEESQVMTLFQQNGFGPPPVPGDVDGDMDVDTDDFDAIRANFRKMVSGRTDGDLVRDGIVNFADFEQWKTAFVGGGGSLADVDFSFLAGVPEPSSALLLLMAGGMLMSGRRRP